VQLHQEVPRKRHTQGRQARLGRQLDVKHGQGHRNAAPRLQHPVQVAVLRIVEIVRVAAEPQLVEEVAVEHAQAVQRRGIGRQAAAEALAQPVHLVDHGLHIQPRLGVLTQQSGGLQQREMRVVGHQGGEVFQGAGGLERIGRLMAWECRRGAASQARRRKVRGRSPTSHSRPK
jgi:hypothetical protein